MSIPIAFYAPLKPPTHANPSGDRHIAQILMQALSLGGFEVELASRFRSRDGSGNPLRQQRLKALGQKLAQRLIRGYSQRPPPERPRLWFTYHLYHKAPDWIGPEVARALGIPYVVVEASYAPKQQTGPWQQGLEASLQALKQAAAVISLNPADEQCLSQILDTRRLFFLPPFLSVSGDDHIEFTNREKKLARQRTAQALKLNPDWPWLACVAMMRPGDKEHSYRLLSEALSKLHFSNWQLLVIGGGEAEAQIKARFAGLSQVRFLGLMDPDQVRPLLQQCDLYVWPAVNEAFGLALLEAQSSGLAVVAGREGGVPSIVEEGLSALLSPPRDADAFATHLETLLTDPKRIRAMGNAARAHIRQYHQLDQGAHQLQRILKPLIGVRPNDHP